MDRQSEAVRHRRGRSTRRRGSVSSVVIVSFVVVIGSAALAIDVGSLHAAQAELQRAADAAALAGAVSLLDEDRLKDSEYLEAVLESARYNAQQYGERNAVRGENNIVVIGEDVFVGCWVFGPEGPGELIFGNAGSFNGTQVTIARSDARGGSIALVFGRLLGHGSASLSASATAAFEDDISGYRVTEGGENAKLLPFALHEDAWDELVTGEHTNGDNYCYDDELKEPFPGSDGLPELNLYPGAGSDQLPPGNFGTVDIGPPNNSTSDIARQILHGVSAADLEYFGGELVFDENGVIMLNGDTGLSAGVKDELEAIKGEPRAIPIFRSVSGPGNNAMYEVVGFVGVRIMDVKLTGAMKKKSLLVQPAIVVDGAATTTEYVGESYGVYRPPQLVK